MKNMSMLRYCGDLQWGGIFVHQLYVLRVCVLVVLVYSNPGYVCTGRIVARSADPYLILLDPAPILLALAQGRFETLVPQTDPSGFPIE